MPFKIIRNNITRVHADAIVNSANPKPVYGSGTDRAIYEAAGAEELLAERRKIGGIRPGDAAVTGAFALPAKYIIHTVGPAWIDGRHGEFEILHSCYRESLAAAERLGCESIAFPLIATGVYGFPKEEALNIALEEIRAFLEHSEMHVTLVVFGRGTYKIASSVADRVEAYIDEHYVEEAFEEEYPRGLEDFGVCGMPLETGRIVYEHVSDKHVCGAPVYEKRQQRRLADVVRHLGETFHDRLFRFIRERRMDETAVYKRANLDRKLFSKIRCSQDYLPKKKNVLALALALQLNLDDARDLLASAGYALSEGIKMDVIVSFCLENGVYDMLEVDRLLFKYTEQTLG